MGEIIKRQEHDYADSSQSRAPVMKWALVIAGIADFARPAENLSLTQNVALTCTGLIWTRWCLIIKPKNYLYVLLLAPSLPELASPGIATFPPINGILTS